MKNHIFKFAKLLFLVVLVGFFTLAAFGQIDFISTLVGTGVLLAAAPVGTTTTSTSTTETVAAGSENLLDSTISKKITEMKPSAYPLDTIMRHIGATVPINSWDYIWYNIDQRNISDTVKTTLSVTGTGSPNNTVHDLLVNNIGGWSIDDNIMFLDVDGSGDKPLVVHVVDKNSVTNKLVVLPLNGIGDNGFDLPEIASGEKMVCIGNAKAETDAQTAPYAAYPQDTSNYAQIHMAQIEQSVYEKLHKKEVNWGLPDYRAQSLYDLRRKMELTSLFGVKGKFYDPVGSDYKYMSAGITRLITKGLEYNPASITNATFAGWGRQIFTGNSGSEKRVLFVGGELMEYLLSIPTITKQIEAKQTEVVWGIKFNKIDTGFGELLVKYHNLFDVTGWIKKGLVLDVNYLEKAVFKPMATRNLMLKESGQKNADAQVVEEAFCVATRYPDLHAIISPESGE